MADDYNPDRSSTFHTSSVLDDPDALLNMDNPPDSEDPFLSTQADDEVHQFDDEFLPHSPSEPPETGFPDPDQNADPESEDFSHGNQLGTIGFESDPQPEPEGDPDLSQEHAAELEQEQEQGDEPQFEPTLDEELKGLEGEVEHPEAEGTVEDEFGEGLEQEDNHTQGEGQAEAEAEVGPDADPDDPEPSFQAEEEAAEGQLPEGDVPENPDGEGEGEEALLGVGEEGAFPEEEGEDLKPDVEEGEAQVEGEFESETVAERAEGEEEDGEAFQGFEDEQADFKAAVGEDGEIEPEGDMGDGGADDKPDLKRKLPMEEVEYDIDRVLDKRRKEGSAGQRRKKRALDSEMLNDSDELIEGVIHGMKVAAAEDQDLNREGRTATKKLKMLPDVKKILIKADMHNLLIENGILHAISDWLSPLPDKNLPSLAIRETMLDVLLKFPPMNSDQLKESSLGKAIMFLYKHPKETRENKQKARKLIHDWARPIFNLTADFKLLTREEREKLDLERSRRGGEEEDNEFKNLKPSIDSSSKLASIPRARVPLPSNKDYVVRPKANPDIAKVARARGGGSSAGPASLEKHMRTLREAKVKQGKVSRAVEMQITGNHLF